MAQDPSSLTIQEILLGHKNISTTFTWSCRQKTIQDKIFNAKPYTLISSDEFPLRFAFQNHNVIIKCCLEICPNGDHHKNPEGYLVIATKTKKLPTIGETMRVISLTAHRRIEIPQISFEYSSENIYTSGSAWNWAPKTLILSRLRTEAKRTFDIKVTISIEKMKIECFKPMLGTTMKNITVDKSDGNNMNADIRTILTKLVNMESKMNSICKDINVLTMKMANMEKIINNGKDEDNKQEDGVNDKYKDNVQLRQFENWILSVFKNNGSNNIGKEYVELIVDKEGFDNLSEFVQLTENDLKEIGIDKKGHRLKFLNKMKQYNQSSYSQNQNDVSQIIDTEGQ